MIKRSDVGITQLRFLSKLACEELLCGFKWTITDPADKSQGKHVLASQGRLGIEPEVFEALLDDGRDGSRDDLLGFQPKFFEWFFGLELSLTQVIGSKRVSVYDDDRVLLQVLDAHL